MKPAEKLSVSDATKPLSEFGVRFRRDCQALQASHQRLSGVPRTNLNFGVVGATETALRVPVRLAEAVAVEVPTSLERHDLP
jgi:hypothetical protein